MKMTKHLSLKRQQGVVIVVALLIVALVTALSYTMMARLERDTRRTMLLLRDTQAESLAQGSIAWAIDQLREDVEKAKPGQLVDAVPIKSPVTKVDGFQVASTIYDMQARFNLNNLSKVEVQKNFNHLLQMIDSKLSIDAAQSITKAIVDWITPGAGSSELARYYKELPIPYLPAHRPMLSVSEVKLVKGVTPVLFVALQPYVIALPVETPINVQTASLPVLASLNSQMTMDTAKAIDEARKNKPFATVDAFSALDVVKTHPVEGVSVTTQSNYFLVETIVTIEMQRAVIYTLLERVGISGKATVNILWQSKGVW